MRRIILFLLTLLILSACSIPSTMTPTATAPAPTLTTEPTRTPEPSPTPDPRYKELMPETYKKCMNDETNTINWDTRYQDLAIIMKRVKEKFTYAPEMVNAFYPGATYKWNANKEELLPEELQLAFENPNNVPFDACVNIKMPNGKRLKVLVLPVRRSESQIVVHVPLVFDQEASLLHEKTVYKRSITVNEAGQEDTYQQMKNGSVFRWGTTIVLAKGSDKKTNEMWANLYSLIPAQPDKATEYYQALEKYFSNRENYSDEEIKQLAAVIEGNFLPTDFTSIITFPS